MMALSTSGWPTLHLVNQIEMLWYARQLPHKLTEPKHLPTQWLSYCSIFITWFFKFLDSTRSKQLERRQEANQANTNRSNHRGNDNSNGTNSSTTNSSTSTPIVKWTGKNMVMKKGMRFSPEDWAKCIQEQKRKIWDLRKTKAKVSSTTASVNSTAVQPATTATTAPTAPSPPAPTPHTVMTNATDVRHLLPNNTLKDWSAPPSHVVIDGRTYTLSLYKRTYSVHHNSQWPSGSLIDGGANGGLIGSDVSAIAESLLTADVTGITNNTLQKGPVCTVAGLIQTQHGPIIGIFHQYAHHGTGKTIHSVSLLSHSGKTPRFINGKQCLETLDGYIIPLSIRSGLPYMDMSPPTPIELDTYPHVFFTSDTEFNPQSIVDELPIHEMDLTDNEWQYNDYHPDTINAYVELTPQARQQDIPYQDRRRNQPDVEWLSPYFGFVPSLCIQHTLDNTTQFAWLESRLPMRKHFKSRFNVSR
jgi:hypothetical protein